MRVAFRPLVFAASICLVFLPGVTHSAAVPRQPEARALAVDRPQFWRGEPVGDSGPESWEEAAVLAHLGTGACDQGRPPVVCFTDYLDVPDAPGTELRVAVEHHSAGDISAMAGGPTPSLEQFALALVGPDKTEHAVPGMTFPFPPGNAVYTPEVRVPNPKPGRWQVWIIAIRVRNPDYVDEPAYRVRANLLSPAPTANTSAGVRELLPNLRSNPPFELIFERCDEPDAAEDARCLRFAQGPMNVGDGPLDLEVGPPNTLNPAGQAGGENIVRAPEFQIIHRSDDTVVRRHIGEAGFHTAHDHMHYHHVATGGYELLAANPETRTLRPVAPGTKAGYCMGDYLMSRWRSFDQAAQRSYTGLFVSSSCGVPNPVTARFGLSQGWGDVYSAGVSGNSVDFGDNPDGYYVIRATTNPCLGDLAATGADCHGIIVESDFEDNTAYTYFRVVNTDTATPTIIPVERGMGTGPFDPNREVVDDYRLFLHPPLS